MPMSGQLERRFYGANLIENHRRTDFAATAFIKSDLAVQRRGYASSDFSRHFE